MNSLIFIIPDKRIHPEVNDRMVWSKSKDGMFSVKSQYYVLESGSVGFFPS